MKTFWKTRTATLVVAAEIALGLFAGNAVACPRGGGYVSHARRSYPVRQVHVHRVTPVSPVVVAPPVSAPAPIIRPASYAVPAPVAAPAAAPAEAPKFPLEMVDLRLVDVGNPQANLGPRFRVVLKNATSFALDRPFEVMASGGISTEFSANLPTAVQAIEKMAPGEVLAVDIRLPLEAMAMQYPGRQEPAPLAVLFVMVAGPKNSLGSSTVTNVATVAVGEVRPVDLAVAAPENPSVAVGAPVEIRGEGFGFQPGQVTMTIGGLKLNAEVLGWSEVGIAIRMPQLALTSPTPVELTIARGDGQTAQPITLTAVLPDAAATTEEVPFPQSAPQNPTAPAPAQAPVAFPAGNQLPPATVTTAEEAASTLSQALSLAQAFGQMSGDGSK